MRLWVAAAGVCILVGCIPSSVQAGGLPVGLLSKQRVGLACMDSIDSNVALDCWLNKHPTVAGAMLYQDANFFGTWSAWPAPVKDQFHTYFNQMVLFYRVGMPPNFPQPIANPLPLQGPPVQMYDGSWLTEADGRTAYLLLVGNNLAAELTAAFPWSIAGYTPAQASMLLSMGDALGNWVGPPSVATAGYYFTGIGHGVPATPAYTLTFFKNNQLIGPSALETIGRLFEWERVLHHYSLEAGVDPADLYTLYWGPAAPPISAPQLIDGTIYTGPSGPIFGHHTAGCHGTMDFMKVVLQALNIPVKIWNTAEHATPYFPTVDRALTHGDDPYDQIGLVTAFPGFPVPKAVQYLATTATLNNLCDPAWPDPSWCEHKVGILPAVIGIIYGSDYLMNLHCQDLAAAKPHATSSVLKLLTWYWPEKTQAEVQQLLESVGMWTNLDAKVAATSFCS